MHTLRFDRRRLFQAGAAGVATVSFAGGWTVLDDAAQAAALPNELRRSSWLGLADPGFDLTAGERTLGLTLREVADLPIAEQIPALRGHDGAFSLRFDGPAGIAQGVHRLRHARLGDVQLFLVPIEQAGAVRSYEAIVDRTIRIAGINEEGEPTVAAPPPERAAQPASMQPDAAAASASAGAAGAGRPARRAAAGTRRAERSGGTTPHVRRVVLTRSATRRVAVADLVLADAGEVASVRAVLLTDGKPVGHASARMRDAGRVRLRFASRRALARRRYELALTLVARDGRVTKIRKRVHVV